MFKHRCRYKVMGTGHGFGKGDETNVVEVDLICPKCGKVGTILASSRHEKEILRCASRDKYLKIPLIDTICVYRSSLF